MYENLPSQDFDPMIKAPLNTKLTLMDCGIGNTNLLGSSSSGLGSLYLHEINRWRHNVFQFGEWDWKWEISN